METTNTIRINRGNTKHVTVGVPGVTFATPDKVLLVVKDTWQSEKVYINKEVTTFVNGKAVFDFSNSDTATMEPGTYTYDVLFIHAGEDKTIIKLTPFIVSPVNAIRTS